MKPDNSINEGRAAQYEAMMKVLAELQTKYKGVRGELLTRVHEALAKTKPGPVAEPAVAPPTVAPPAVAAAKKVEPLSLPSCRLCGRGMKRSEEGDLVCSAGHVRAAA